MMDFSDLSRLAGGHAQARIVQTAVRMDVFETFQRAPLDSLAVAATLATDPRATELLLNALAALGLLDKQENRFSLTPPSKTYLVRSSPKYLGDMILFDGSLWGNWENLEEAIRLGKPVRTPNMYQDNPDETERFIRAMDSLVRARGDAEILAQSFDWSGVSEFLDIGSGPGTYPIYLCRRFPNLNATIFDLPGTLEFTARNIRNAGLEKRIKMISGDYKTGVIPGTYQMILMSNIIHAESFETNEALIAGLYPLLVRNGKLLIKDHILDETGTHPSVGAIFSMLMLLTTELGRCYALNEIESWLIKSGFNRISRTDLPPPFTSSIVIGEK